MKVPTIELIPIVRELTPKQSGAWVRKRGIGDIPKLIKAFGVQNLLVFLRTLGFEKNIHIMDVLGLEELIELAYTISGMKLPGLSTSGKKQKKFLKKFPNNHKRKLLPLGRKILENFNFLKCGNSTLI
ncbi:hypothetical protein LEP1GSC124_3257 [Leptospira interrogans serovar Pyrogenes str. 200701872]|uniref:Uncharacterized protein n=1 Tax=Leptospira interrogans serovar Pyrogenes str. 200701872 TaxID=1193029 RepID=M6ZXQ0_LEPIR|nr:hypothetical protein LEP1GSC124_3257 [Leptospira interrogans serovar Pyrogenes str. 200701872]